MDSYNEHIHLHRLLEKKEEKKIIVVFFHCRQNIRHNVRARAVRVSAAWELGHLQAAEREVAVGAVPVLLGDVPRHVRPARVQGDVPRRRHPGALHQRVLRHRAPLQGYRGLLHPRGQTVRLLLRDQPRASGSYLLIFVAYAWLFVFSILRYSMTIVHLAFQYSNETCSDCFLPNCLRLRLLESLSGLCIPLRLKKRRLHNLKK